MAEQKYPFGNELKSRYTRRAKFRDYQAPGYYMITILKKRNIPNFSRVISITNQDVASTQRGESQGGGYWGKVVNPVVELSQLGQMIDRKIDEMPLYTPALEIVNFVVMPDHLHILIHVKERLDRHLGKILGGFMGGCTSLARSEGYIEENDNLFEPKFHDRIALKEGQVSRMKRYIDDNPRRLVIKKLRPDLFKRYLHLNIEGREYAAFGNIFLLRYDNLLPVRIHRRWSEAEFEEYHASCLQELKAGAAVISPFIHKAEKRIRQCAFEMGNRVIEIRDLGFEERFKPQGAYFDLCAQGKLLLIAPWPENKRKSTAGSREFHSMNDVALMISELSHESKMTILANS